MFPVLSRPNDDDEIVEVYMADHDTKTKEQFEVEWMQTEEVIMEKDPEYNVSQIIVAMKRKGWKIFLTQPAKVTY